MSGMLDDARGAEFHDIYVDGAFDKEVINVDGLLLAESASTADCLGHGSIICVL